MHDSERTSVSVVGAWAAEAGQGQDVGPLLRGLASALFIAEITAKFCSPKTWRGGNIMVTLCTVGRHAARLYRRKGALLLLASSFTRLPGSFEEAPSGEPRAATIWAVTACAEGCYASISRHGV